MKFGRGFYNNRKNTSTTTELNQSKMKNQPRLVCETGLGWFLLFLAESSKKIQNQFKRAPKILKLCTHTLYNPFRSYPQKIKSKSSKLEREY